MSEYVWNDIRNRAIDLFGGAAPGAQLEEDVVGVFLTHPQIVARAVDHVADRWRTGNIRDPWAVLRKHVQQATIPGREAVAVDASDRDRAVTRAEQLIRSALVHFDRESEVEQHLFGDSRLTPDTDRDGTPIESAAGILTPWATDLTLRQRIIDTWRQERPRGERCEHEADQRAALHVDQRRRTQAAARQHRDRLDQAQADHQRLRGAPEPALGG